MSSSEFDYTKYLLLIAKRKCLFAVVALAIMTGTVIVSYLLPKKYEARSTVAIEKSVISDLVKGIAVTPTVEDKLKELTYSMNSRNLLLKVIDELDLYTKKPSSAELEQMVRRFQNSTAIYVRGNEGLFTVSFVHENPRIARDYVNTLVRRYIEENVSSKREESYGATNFLSEQIAAFKEKLGEAETAVTEFRKNKGTLLFFDQGSIQKEIDDAQLKLDEMQHRLTMLESKRKLLKKGNPLPSNLSALQKKLEDLRMEYTDNYPEVIKVRSEIESVKQQLAKRDSTSENITTDPQELENIDIEVRYLKGSIGNVRAQIAENRSILRGIPAARATLEELEQEKLNRKSMYEQLYGRHQQSEVSKQMEVQDKATPFRIVDAAIMPTQPVSPNRVKIIAMGILAGLAGGFGLLLLLDFLDHSVKSADILKTLDVPVLAVVPIVRDPQSLQKQAKKDRLLYLMSGSYFSLILAILATELLGITVLDTLVTRIREYL